MAPKVNFKPGARSNPEPYIKSRSGPAFVVSMLFHFGLGAGIMWFAMSEREIQTGSEINSNGVLTDSEVISETPNTLLNNIPTTASPQHLAKSFLPDVVARVLGTGHPTQPITLTTTNSLPSTESDTLQMAPAPQDGDDIRPNELTEKTPVAEVKNNNSNNQKDNLTNGAGIQSLPAGALVSAASAESFGELESNVPPEYPLADRRAGHQGQVVFIAHVSKTGEVDQIEFEQSSRSETLDDAALAAMSKWKFRPGREGWVRKVFAFGLQAQAQSQTNSKFGTAATALPATIKSLPAKIQ